LQSDGGTPAQAANVCELVAQRLLHKPVNAAFDVSHAWSSLHIATHSLPASTGGVTLEQNPFMHTPLEPGVDEQTFPHRPQLLGSDDTFVHVLHGVSPGGQLPLPLHDPRMQEPEEHTCPH